MYHIIRYDPAPTEIVTTKDFCILNFNIKSVKQWVKAIKPW